jgi:hypothetical protein
MNKPPQFASSHGGKVALRSIGVEVVFKDLLCETVMTQAYQSLEQRLFEAQRLRCPAALCC